MENSDIVYVCDKLLNKLYGLKLIPFMVWMSCNVLCCDFYDFTFVDQNSSIIFILLLLMCFFFFPEYLNM